MTDLDDYEASLRAGQRRRERVHGAYAAGVLLLALAFAVAMEVLKVQSFFGGLKAWWAP